MRARTSRLKTSMMKVLSSSETWTRRISSSRGDNPVVSMSSATSEAFFTMAIALSTVGLVDF
jgi:hypothetical protein